MLRNRVAYKEKLRVGDKAKGYVGSNDVWRLVGE